jgi:hypothetical protein
MTTLLEFGNERVLCVPDDGTRIDSDRNAANLVGEAFGAGATLVAVPAGRLGPDFFQLRTGLAGIVAQKFGTYRLKFAVIGDITAYLAASNALRDWVRESNRGHEIWFVPDLAALAARLDPAATPQ